MALLPKFKEEYLEILRNFIPATLNQSGKEGVVIGLSGGLDSSVLLRICKDTLGSGRVLALFMPDDLTPRRDFETVRSLAAETEVDLEVVDIADMVRSFYPIFEDRRRQRVELGNVKARCRMIVLFHYSHTRNLLVAGTSNKSELLLGYFTKYGDGGADFLPLGDLYKTQVKGMAEHLELPQEILDRVPSAGLWPGQTDEGEIGLSYEMLDSILHGIELEMSTSEIGEKTGIDSSTIERIEEMVRNSAHKRKLALIPKMGVRTVGLDWRE